MLAVAQEQIEGVPDVTLVEADVLSLRLDERFDLVTCFGALGHILPEDAPRLLATIHRHLRPGGRFAFATATLPSWRRPGRWLAEGFDAAMRVRNALIDPPFVMYYLTFLLPECLAALEEAGFASVVHHPVLEGPWARLRVVVAERRG